MGLLDRLKHVMDPLTGGAARLAMEWEPEVPVPGQPVRVTVGVQATGAEVESEGIFVDVKGERTMLVDSEESVKSAEGEKMHEGEMAVEATSDVENAVELAAEIEGAAPGPGPDTSVIYRETFRVSEPLVLRGAESKTVTATIELPADLEPTGEGELGCHYGIRARLEAFGNDPDTGFVTLEVREVREAEQ